MTKTKFTSEHVSPGHPDKVMDSIAEAIVDYHVDHGNGDRVAVDGICKNEIVFLAGEVTTELFNSEEEGHDSSEHQRDVYAGIMSGVLSDIGYTPNRSVGFNCRDARMMTLFTQQSPDIAVGVNLDQVDAVKESGVGAGDIGIMFGGAVKEAPDFTCHSHYLARLLSYTFFAEKKHKHIYPDQKTQVSIEYTDGVPTAITDVVVCLSHDKAMSHYDVQEFAYPLVHGVIANYGRVYNLSVENVNILINPTGAFTLYGPFADSGEVGRKIVCDQFGGYFPVGGGNLNGKCATKVDRSAVYMARYVSKQLVAAGLADKCLIQVSYAIGVPDPVSINVETSGTAKVSQEELDAFVAKYSFRVNDIIEKFKLSSKDREFSYQGLGMYGHIGDRFYDKELPWEHIEL